MLKREDFARVFKVGEIIESGAGFPRKNGARLQIIALEDDLIRYQSINSMSGSLNRYDYLSLIIENFEKLDPRSIQRSVNAVLKSAGFKSDFTTENYVYGLARAFIERTQSSLFLSEGETQPQSSGLLGRDFKEGQRVAVYVERIERDNAARAKCIQYHGTICKACSFDFGLAYGELGMGYIHVHHCTTQLSETSGVHNIDPIRDLIPLCPNCHAMVHARTPMLTIEALQLVLRTNMRSPS
jgi:predicted HNH restriction endonuclease